MDALDTCGASLAHSTIHDGNHDPLARINPIKRFTFVTGKIPQSQAKGLPNTLVSSKNDIPYPRSCARRSAAARAWSRSV